MLRQRHSVACVIRREPASLGWWLLNRKCACTKRLGVETRSANNESRESRGCTQVAYAPLFSCNGPTTKAYPVSPQLRSCRWQTGWRGGARLRREVQAHVEITACNSVTSQSIKVTGVSDHQRFVYCGCRPGRRRGVHSTAYAQPRRQRRADRRLHAVQYCLCSYGGFIRSNRAALRIATHHGESDRHG